MRKGTGIAGATLLFGPRDRVPDLVQAMQYLLDDLRGEGRRIVALKLTPSTMRLRADPYEMVLTVAGNPLPATALQGLLRPPAGEAPDFTRVHLARTLRRHHHAMGFLLRRRGAPILDEDEAMRLLAEEGKFALMPVLEATTPSLLIWQPGGLVLSTEEFRRAEPALLLQPGDPAAPIVLPQGERLRLPRPGAPAGGALALVDDTPAAAAPASGAGPASRADRGAHASLGRLFGRQPARPAPMPRLDRSSDRVAAALRTAPSAAPAPSRAAAGFWGVVLPALTGLGDPT